MDGQWIHHVAEIPVCALHSSEGGQRSGFTGTFSKRDVHPEPLIPLRIENTLSKPLVATCAFGA